SCWMNGTAGGMSEGGFRLRIGDSCVVSGMTYHILQQSNNLYPDEWYNSPVYLREDSTGKVWKTSVPGTAGEFLLYDFNLNPGDTIQYLKCDSTNTVFLGGFLRKRLYFSCLGWTPPTWTSDIWIEGMGSIKSSLLFPANNCTVGLLLNTVCVHEHGSLVFTDTTFTNCYPVSPNYSNEQWTPSLQTHWYYDYPENDPFSTYPNKGYVYVHTVKDTVISSHSCKKLISTFINHLGQTVRNVPFYTYVDTRKIYYSFSTNFSILFDFGANPGDSWSIRNPYEMFGLTPGPDSMTVITVDSVNAHFTFFPYDMYKQLYTHSNSSWFYKEPARVRYGCDWFFFPGRWNDWNYPMPGHLRCYEDMLMAGITYYMPCDDLVTGISDVIPGNEGIQVINPAEDDFRILLTGRNRQSGIIDLFDNQGRMIKSVLFNGETEITIPGTSIAPGMYVVRIVPNGSSPVCRKVIKL
ncbi:MAG: T9SS type A sorting domain-containing protein, partial [Bacteroidetes bacterium]|nr:T9SS type A sorting domain-containing protein [Bacteroidota bacterium]